MLFVTLAQLRGRFRKLSREQFVARVTRPHLVVTRVAANAVGTGGVTSADQLAHELVPVSDDARPVYELTKSDRNNFASMITVGRATRNDVILIDGSVSNFHCYFRSSDERWSLFDAGSTHGTFVGDQRLLEHLAHPLASGDTLRIGSAGVFMFLEPDALFDYLHGGALTARKATA